MNEGLCRECKHDEHGEECTENVAKEEWPFTQKCPCPLQPTPCEYCSHEVHEGPCTEKETGAHFPCPCPLRWEGSGEGKGEEITEAMRKQALQDEIEYIDSTMV